MEVNQEKLISHLAKLNPVAAETIINYIISQLNNESLVGSINEFEYRILMPQSIDGLYNIVYIDFADLEDRMQDALYISGKELIILLFTRVRGGLDHQLKKAEIEAKARPIIAAH